MRKQDKPGPPTTQETTSAPSDVWYSISMFFGTRSETATVPGTGARVALHIRQENRLYRRTDGVTCGPEAPLDQDN